MTTTSHPTLPAVVTDLRTCVPGPPGDTYVLAVDLGTGGPKVAVIAATGAAITTKIVYEMERRDLHLGLVTLCIGGGQGIALLLER